jgi:hypothetical protein
MPFSWQIRSNSTSAGAGLDEPAGKHRPVVAEHLFWHPVDRHRVDERSADRPRGGPQHRLSQHAVPGMVIDPGHDLS